MNLVLSVVGTGYLGTTHAACMASLGFRVIAVDTDANKIAQLSRGELPFFEPGLETILKEQLSSGRLTFSTDFSDLSEADVHFICVGTPQKVDSLAADLSYIESAFDSLISHLKDGSLVVGKSTAPVGTAEGLSRRLTTVAPHSDLAWNPEFLREGFAVEDTLRPNRLVVGVQNDKAENILKTVYATLISNGTPWIRADLPTSELVKVAANSFLATKISFINAMAEICEVAGADVTVLAEAIGYDSRIGSRFLRAGIGFGGGCLPKDIRAFMARAEELGAKQSLDFLREIDVINIRARHKAVEEIRTLLHDDLRGKRIAVLGAAFKPDTDDVRDSPALDIASLLFAGGAHVVIHDPKALNNARNRFPELEFADSVDLCARDSDIVLHLTEWQEYRTINPTTLRSMVKNPVIFDGRNALDRELWTSAGWKFHSVGRKNT